MSRTRIAAVATTVALLGIAAPASAQERTVEAYGQATVVPKPKNPRNDASIAAAVKAAAATAVTRAIDDAKKHATELATGAGVTLGELLSISNPPLQQFPFYGPFFNEDGTFGPGKYCGRTITLRRVIGKNGKPRFIRRTRRTCRIPRVVRQVELTYAIA